MADSLVSAVINPRTAPEFRRRFPREIRVEPISITDERFDTLWEKLRPAYHGLAVRDRSWVQWRFLEMPGAEHHVFLALNREEPVGYIALRTVREEGVVRACVVDFFLGPEDAATATALLERAMSHATTVGAYNLAALAAPGWTLHGYFMDAGFRSGGIGFDFSLIPYDSLPCRVSAVPRLGFVTGAEGDVV
jgi:hypothetical protein